LRVYGCHADDPRGDGENVARLLNIEQQFGLQDIATYMGFQKRADAVKDALVSFLIDTKRDGEDDWGLRCRREREHTPELWRGKARPLALRVRRGTLKAGKIHAGKSHSNTFLRTLWLKKNQISF
jgi:hypothetical protein